MNTYWFYLKIKMFCISIFTILLLKLFDHVNFMTHNLNLLSYIELVGGVFAPLLFVFLCKFAVKWLKYDTSPTIIYWLLCFEQVYNQLINLPNKGIFGGRFISFAPLVIDRCIS